MVWHNQIWLCKAACTSLLFTFTTTMSTYTVSKPTTVLFCRYFQSQIQRWVINTTWNGNYAITGKWWWGTTNRRAGEHRAGTHEPEDQQEAAPVLGTRRPAKASKCKCKSGEGWQTQTSTKGGGEGGSSAWVLLKAHYPSHHSWITS